MLSLETTSGDSETTSPFCTWKGLLGNKCGELPEVTATAGSCGDCWKLRRLLEAAACCLQGLQYD